MNDVLTELEYIAYFENLAAKNKAFLHNADTNPKFFYLPEPWDLTAIDNVLKKSIGGPLMLLDAMNGDFDNEDSQNYVQTIAGQITIVNNATTGDAVTIRIVRDACLPLCVKLLARMRYDFRRKQLFNPKNAFFAIKAVKYDPVGPMYSKYYGYTFRFTITSTFGFVVDSTSWTDLEP